ncbi:MAG: tRNA lysidine(34) synthetase TilS [Clostridia bacterium]|nr:tRNA lysidine(34) synthetase TilS [Clostridia bacterium]
MRNLKEKNIVELIEEEVEKNIIRESLIENGDKLIVAVSGGPDSICLLNVLYTIRRKMRVNYGIEYSLIVAHVNHMLREESEDEKVYVENICKNLEIPFYYLKKDVRNLSKQEKMSEETYGRKIRYEFFNEVLEKEKAQKIVTAHNANDDVETILLNLFRGCGLKGLTGIEFQYKNIIRPLMTVEKKDIMEYNILKNLNPCIDRTNFELICPRNKVRNALIPELEKEYNPNILKSILRMKNILIEDENFLNNYTLNVVKQSIIEYNEYIKFNYSELIKEHVAIKNRAIREIIKLKLHDLDGLTNIHINDILDLLENGIKGKKYIMGNKFKIEIINKNIAILY